MDFKHAFLVLHSKQADFFVHLKTETAAKKQLGINDS